MLHNDRQNYYEMSSIGFESILFTFPFQFVPVDIKKEAIMQIESFQDAL